MQPWHVARAGVGMTRALAHAVWWLSWQAGLTKGRSKEIP
jgi:hypothetical protein